MFPGFDRENCDRLCMLYWAATTGVNSVITTTQDLDICSTRRGCYSATGCLWWLFIIRNIVQCIPSTDT